MPPTIPCGLPTVGIVFAQLMANGSTKGVFPFIVNLNDGKEMCPGVTARLLPYRGGSSPVNHSLTSFADVYLPSNALLRPVNTNADADYSATRRLDFLASIWRVAVGTLSLAAQRRTVAIPGGRTPLITFTTTHGPILTALSRSFVLDEFFKSTTSMFCDQNIDFRVRHGVAAAMKVVALQHAQEGNLELSERCGNQGLFGHNQMTTFHADQRGIAIAEGDLLGLSIRLCSELLLGRYELPESTHPSSPLAQHEISLLVSTRTIIFSMDHHRAPNFNDQILPLCQPIVEAIGLRMAYDAALDAGFDTRITDVYLATAISRDPAWYSEHLGLTKERQREMQREAFQAALPLLDKWLNAASVEEYAIAPIISAKRWSRFIEGLEVFEGPTIKTNRLGMRRNHDRNPVSMDEPIRAYL